MKKLGLVIIYIAFFFSMGIAQPVNNIVGDVVMPAPNAAALHKFSEIPMSLFTGTPNISIPLYTVQDGKVSFPIALGYHASGVKVGEMASFVGQNWSLSTGAITRTVVGVPDDNITRKGYFYEGTTLELTNEVHAYEVANGIRDGEPDIFSFSMPGYSGKFYFDGNQQAHLIPRQDLKIEQPTIDNGFAQFTIVAPDGTKYFFGKVALKDGTSMDAREWAKSTNETQFAPSSWNLVRIESHDGKDYIEFSYQEELYNYRSLATCTYYNTTGGCPAPSLDCTGAGVPYSNKHQAITTEAKGKRLTHITTSTGVTTVELVGDTTRLDLGSSGIAPKRLDALKVSSGSFCMKYQFSYSYWVDDSSNYGSWFYPAGSNVPEFKRLRLDKLQKFACNDNTIKEGAYEFSYIEAPGRPDFLPFRLSKAIDHWGYYNGVDNNNASYYNIPTGTTVGGFTFGDANRDPIETTTQYGTLREIKYPTGGTTTFDFELNSYYAAETSEYALLQPTTLKSCTSPDVDNCCGEKSDSIEYTFTDSTELSFATYSLYLDPIFIGDCSGNTPTQISIKAYDVTDPDSLIEVGSLSANLLSGDSSNYILDKALTELETYGYFQVNVPYRFVIETTNGFGRFELFSSTPTNSQGGGLRVKNITYSDNDPDQDDIVRSFSYTRNDNVTSSGRMRFLPTYGFVTMGESTDGLNTYPLKVFRSTSVVPLNGYAGYNIGYERVEEITNGNGIKIHEYYTPAYSPSSPTNLPQMYPQEGKVKSINSFNENGTLVASQEMFGTSNLSTSNIPILKAKRYEVDCDDSLYDIYSYYSQTYNIRGGYFQNSLTISTIDDVTTTTSYEYDQNVNHLFPTKVTMTNSDGITHVTENEYVFDKAAFLVYSTMIDRNMIATPIEVTKKVDNEIVDATQTVYGFFQSDGTPGISASDAIYPKEYQRLEKTWDANGTLISDNWQTLGTVLSYDPQTGKPASFQQPGWEVENYTWDATNKQIKTRTYKDFTWTYNYYPGTNLVSEMIDIDGQDTDFTYDPLMRLKTVNARDGNVITTYDYHFTTGGTDKNYVKTRTDFTPVGDSELHFQESWQYMDGLGRPLQTVQVGYAPNGSDLVTGAVEYDNQGRVVTSYEPFEGGTSGAFTAPSGPATTTQYYDSPLNRIEKVTPPNWYATTYTYGNNANAIPVGGKTYSSGELIAQTVTDPDGIATTTYTDKKGRVILTEVKEGSDISKTYTIHDDKDRVKTVLPPGVTNITSPLAFQYEYDGADNVIRKYIPDMGWMSYLYDERDLLTASQDPKLLSEGKWLTSTYDDYGRVVETGFYNENTSSLLNGNNSVVQQVLSTTLYDGVCGQSDPIYLGKVCQTRTRVLGTNDWLETNFEYDAHGRTIKTVGNNHVNLSIGSEEVNLTYDWADNLISSNRIHQAFGQQVVINERMTYDHSGRLEDTYHRVGTGAEQLISRQEYSSKDELQIKHLGGFGNSFLQKVDYNYLDNGFLKGINETMEANDLFQLNLQYDAVITGVNAVPRKNGNISQLIWQTQGDTMQSYGFQYDFLNRLEVATYGDYSTGSLNSNNHYTSSYQYDARGNITTLDRFGAVDGLGHPAIDNLVYAYDTGNSNRLQSIIDNAGTTARDQGFKPGVGGNYQYDENGNMNYDPHKGINIQYNHLNLPEFIEFSDCEIIDNTYDASGAKLRKTIKSSTAVISTQDYLGGIEYRNGVLEAIYHSEGRLYYDNDTIRYEYTLSDHLGNNRLTFTDFNADGIIDPDEVMEKTHYYPFGMRMEGNGLINRGRENKYLYNGKELNEEFGLNWASYGAREYDASIGRWMSVDPLAEKYMVASPYNYTLNNPIKYIDPDGKQVKPTTSKNDDGDDVVTIQVTGSIIDLSSNWMANPKRLARRLKRLGKQLSGNKTDLSGLGIEDKDGNEITEAIVNFEFSFKAVDKMSEIGENDHLIALADFDSGEKLANGLTNTEGGKLIFVDANATTGPLDFTSGYGTVVTGHEIVSHALEVGHKGGNFQITTGNGVQPYSRNLSEENRKAIVKNAYTKGRLNRLSIFSSYPGGKLVPNQFGMAGGRRYDMIRNGVGLNYARALNKALQKQ